MNHDPFREEIWDMAALGGGRANMVLLGIFCFQRADTLGWVRVPSQERGNTTRDQEQHAHTCSRQRCRYEQSTATRSVRRVLHSCNVG